MSAIFEAIRDNNTALVINLLENDKTLLNTQDERGSTPLLLASYYGFNDIELDFITNYDIKFRIKDGSDDEE